METQNLSLVALVKETANIEQMLLESEGEMTPEIEASLAITETALPEKIDGYAFVLERLEVLENYYAAKAEEFKQIATKCKNAQKRLKENIVYACQEMGSAVLNGKDNVIFVKPTQGKLILTDEEAIDIKYKSQEIKTVIDTKSLKEDVKKLEYEKTAKIKALMAAGASEEEIKAEIEKPAMEGAYIEPGFSVSVKANLPGSKKAKKSEVANV